MQMISAFVFVKQIVQFLYFLNQKFQASDLFLWLYSPVCVGTYWKDGNPVDRFSFDVTHLVLFTSRVTATYFKETCNLYLK